MFLLASGCGAYTALTTNTGTPGTYFGMSKDIALKRIQETDKVLDVGEDFIVSKGVWNVSRDERVKVFAFQSGSLSDVSYLPLVARGKDLDFSELMKAGVPLDQIIERARGGDWGAEHTLCYAFIYGKGIGRDDRLARRWCTAAANQGRPSSQTLLGEVYMEGRGVAKNYQTAFEWYLKAAEQGHPHAQLMVGELYLVGAGTKRNHDKARQWMQKSAEQGYSLAKKRLAEIQ